MSNQHSPTLHVRIGINSARSSSSGSMLIQVQVKEAVEKSKLKQFSSKSIESQVSIHCHVTRGAGTCKNTFKLKKKELRLTVEDVSKILLLLYNGGYINLSPSAHSKKIILQQLIS